jgi:hypothetical protein
MSVPLKYLSPEERREWECGLDDALDESGQADLASVDRLEGFIAEADRAGREWPDIIRRQWQREGMRLALKSRLKSRETVEVAYNGQVVTKPASRGVRVVLEDGAMVWQQRLFESMTWEELTQAQLLNREQINSLRINDAIAAKLIALQTLAPDSTGPKDACDQLGTTIDAVLAA